MESGQILRMSIVEFRTLRIEDPLLLLEYFCKQLSRLVKIRNQIQDPAKHMEKRKLGLL